MLATIAMYAISYLTLPFTLPTGAGSPAGRTAAYCNCAMCKTDATGTHHCPCCDHGGACLCGMGNHEDDSAPVMVQDVASLPMNRHFEIALPDSGNITTQPAAIADFDLTVPVPPPKA